MQHVLRAEELAERRRDRATAADARLCRLLAASVDDTTGVALVAVGGYGRAELSPQSDLDVVLVHDERWSEDRVAEVAASLWYPLWDDGVALDHAVRSTDQMLAAADADHRAATGMLDARAVAGDTSLVLALRSRVLARWRRDARRRLPELRAASRERIERSGWLAHAAVPDLKESGGGLRDGVAMRALVATWLVDVRHGESERLRAGLLDVRDALHEVTGRRSDRLDPEHVPDVARLLGREPDALDLHVRDLGRRTAHLAGLAWRQVDAVLSSRPRGSSRIEPLAAGVGRLGDEVVLSRDSDPARDPGLVLRAAAVAAQAELPLAAASARRLAEASPPPEPWTEDVRRSCVDLLGAGPGLVRVWEELDLAGAVEPWLPEWAPVRSRGSSSPVHRYTVDRHSLQTCIEASSLVRAVERPDLLLVAALLHDVGKGLDGDHSVVGEPVARRVAARWGFDDHDAGTVARLVRWHLLLPTVATRRDIEDPATAEGVAQRVGDVATLDLLVALTEADARATGPSAWTTWRAGLVRGLVDKVGEVLSTGAPEADPATYTGWSGRAPDLGDADLAVAAERGPAGSVVRISAPDRPGLMADLAAGLALAGHPVVSARVWSDDGVVGSVWETTADDVDPERLRHRLRRVLDGTLDPAARLAASDRDGTAPVVRIAGSAARTATVLEVRARDRRGLVWAVARAVTDAGADVRSAHVSTFGAEARDVFYVTGPDGEALGATDAERVRERVLAAVG